MFKCTGKEKIYVVSPAYNRTGGLELLHQLVFILNKKKLNAYITYFDVNTERDDSPINPAYQKYVSEYKTLDDIDDYYANIVVLPELLINLIDKFKNAKIAVWWLSVDNYLKGYTLRKSFELLGFKGVMWYLKNMKWKYRITKINSKIKYNLAQSYYAIDFLKSNGFFNIQYLSDYINFDYIKSDLYEEERANVVLYNPKKGLKYTKYLMSLDDTICWKPLQNMTNEQVKFCLLNSKVYVDFGNHPGKDRFPREAAACGCCIITGKRGSANYYEDVPIPSEFKFIDSNTSGIEVIKKIKNCFYNFEDNQKKFSTYREMISNEFCRFNYDVEKVFLG